MAVVAVDGPSIVATGAGTSITATGDASAVEASGTGASVVVTITTGTGGVTVHNNLTGRDTADAHPISAVTGLQDALDAAGGGGSVDSVNTQTGVVVLDAADVGAEASGAVSTHNAAVDAHADIRTDLDGKAVPSDISTAVSTHNTDDESHEDLRNPQVFRVGLLLSEPIGVVGGTFGTGTFTIGFLAGFFPLGADVLLRNQTDPANDGLYRAIIEGDPGLSNGTFTFRPEVYQPFRLRNLGAPLFSNSDLSGVSTQWKIASSDGVNVSLTPLVPERASGLIPEGVAAATDFRLFADGALPSPTRANGIGAHNAIVELTTADDFESGSQQPAFIEGGMFRLQATGTQEAGVVHSGPYSSGNPAPLTFPNDMPIEIGVLHGGFLDNSNVADLWNSGVSEPRRSSTNITFATNAGNGYTIQANTEGDGTIATTTLALYKRAAWALGSPLATFVMPRVVGTNGPDRYSLNIVPKGATTRLVGMLNGRAVMEATDGSPIAVSTLQIVTHTHNNVHAHPVTTGKWRPGSIATWIRKGASADIPVTAADIPVTPPPGTGNLTAAVDDLQTLVDEVDDLTLGGPLCVIPDARHLQAAYGTPAFDWETTTSLTSNALNLGEAQMAFGQMRTVEDLRRVLFHIAATNLTAGQDIEVVCYGLDNVGLPGELEWMVPVEVGTSTGDIVHDFGAASGLRLPDRGYWIGVWNPSGNAGTVTFRTYYAQNRHFSSSLTASSLDRFTALRGPEAVTAPADLSGFDVNSAPNTSTRFGISFTAPGLWLR